MNFFGHAQVASWGSDDPRVVLGAMLPDFASMCGGRLGPVTGAPAVGVDLHHRTDAAFHASAIFRQLCTAAARALDAMGVRRGPSRGAAHAGVEILLDGVLASDARAVALYREALVVDDGGVTWAEASHRERFHGLRERLVTAPGGPSDSLDPEIAGRRLCVALERRPLLAPAPSERPLLVAWLATTRPLIEAAAPDLMADVRRVLEAHRG